MYFEVKLHDFKPKTDLKWRTKFPKIQYDRAHGCSHAISSEARKSSCANMQEAYRPQHNKSTLCCSGGGGVPTLVGGVPTLVGGVPTLGRGLPTLVGGVPTLGRGVPTLVGGGTYPRWGTPPPPRPGKVGTPPPPHHPHLWVGTPP